MDASSQVGMNEQHFCIVPERLLWLQTRRYSEVRMRAMAMIFAVLADKVVDQRLNTYNPVGSMARWMAEGRIGPRRRGLQGPAHQTWGKFAWI